MDDVIDAHWVHVMDDDAVVDVIALYAEITSVVSKDYVVANLLPLSRPVELLIDPTIEAERRLSDLSPERQIPIALFKR